MVSSSLARNVKTRTTPEVLRFRPASHAPAPPLAQEPTRQLNGPRRIFLHQRPICKAWQDTIPGRHRHRLCNTPRPFRLTGTQQVAGARGRAGRDPVGSQVGVNDPLRYTAESPHFKATGTDKGTCNRQTSVFHRAGPPREAGREAHTMRRLHTDYVDAITQEIGLYMHKNARVTQEESDSTRRTPTTAIHPIHVIHDETNVIHKAWICETTTQPITWMTRYGWKLDARFT